MTEYETADLAASNISNLIGLGSMIQMQIVSMTDAIQQFMAVLFSYIAAAYLAGAKMGRRQVWIMTSLYVLWQIWMIAAVVSRGVFLSLIQERFIELGGSASALQNVPIVLRSTSTLLLLCALLASLYFMWSVRHPEKD